LQGAGGKGVERAGLCAKPFDQIASASGRGQRQPAAHWLARHDNVENQSDRVLAPPLAGAAIACLHFFTNWSDILLMINQQTATPPDRCASAWTAW
jgi:hypothetical protein